MKTDQASVTREECEATILESSVCLECRYCKKHVYDDANRPGFHYTECVRHRDALRLARAHIALLDSHEQTIQQLQADKERLEYLLQAGCITLDDDRRYFHSREAIDAARGVDPANSAASAPTSPVEAK